MSTEIDDSSRKYLNEFYAKQKADTKEQEEKQRSSEDVPLHYVLESLRRKAEEYLRMSEEQRSRAEEHIHASEEQRCRSEEQRRKSEEQRYRANEELVKNDPYYILGICSKATKQEIRKSYLSLCIIHHPDKNGGDDTQFKKIANAYKNLYFSY